MLDRQDEANSDNHYGPKTWKLVNRLRQHIYTFFPPEQDFLEEYTLQHGDISFRNLLVTDSGSITGLVDWEFVYFAPHCDSLSVSDFIAWLDWEYGADNPPDRDNYAVDADGTVDPSFYLDLQDDDLTRLRPLFEARLSSLCPQWAYDRRDRRCLMQADFIRAVRKVAALADLADVGLWLDEVEKEGMCRSVSLRSRYMYKYSSLMEMMQPLRFDT